MEHGTIIQGVGLLEVLRDEVQDALARQQIETSEFAEFYLVNLLGDFHDAEVLFDDEGIPVLDKPIALLYMEAMNADIKSRAKCLKHIGDSALIVAGFFADRLRRTLMGLPYYVAMGGEAYRRLSNVYTLDNQKMFQELYLELAANFEGLVQALARVAPWNRGASSNAELVRVYERWLASGDEKLQGLLEKEGIQT